MPPRCSKKINQTEYSHCLSRENHDLDQINSLFSQFDSAVQWFPRNGCFFDALWLYKKNCKFFDFSSIFATVSSTWKRTLAVGNTPELLRTLFDIIKYGIYKALGNLTVYPLFQEETRNQP